MSETHPSSIARVESLSLIGAEPDAATLATDTGVALVITSPREGVLRLRLGSPDGAAYPIMSYDQSAGGLTLEIVEDETTITIAAGEMTLAIRKAPVDFELTWCGRTVTRAITDKHFRNWTRLPVLAHDAKS